MPDVSYTYRLSWMLGIQRHGVALMLPVCSGFSLYWTLAGPNGNVGRETEAACDIRDSAVMTTCLLVQYRTVMPMKQAALDKHAVKKMCLLPHNGLIPQPHRVAWLETCLGNITSLWFSQAHVTVLHPKESIQT